MSASTWASSPASHATSAPSTSAPMTVAPSERKSAAVALPMPEPAPVTIATLPSSRMLRELDERDRAVVDFVRPVREPEGANSRPAGCERRVLTNASGAERLHRVINHLERHVRRLDLDHRDLGLGGLVAGFVHQVRRLE